ncbi:MAG: biopolymer transporter ExbD [Gammaproteobacteria bacterium]|jgi:biopolymer transport protein ExbD|nr:biopolymer transporter ExbD [Gammaproteobacteria bacterium]MBT3488489.1 biopolymer transporter ExbD [Gammaproteobacteria bacterium]MBT3718183.1 biopolymer transporter ExbD [Gammaproteobacteria bacterium]MBT3844274.1 biopolymer transporter ExbD [Gammaproteobacteria bacterium]MBT3893022.1 biopolymer transporter ExbD [Gammaproteobacteria bacterium]
MSIHSNGGNHEHPLSEINVTPLVDVMLVLLVIFIIVAPVFSQAIRVDLPVASAESSGDPVVVDLTLDQQGALYLNSELLQREQLAPQLQQKIAEDQALVVRISADGAANYQSVAELLSLVQASGVSRIAFATQSIQ